jgi:hypothetical protein
VGCSCLSFSMELMDTISSVAPSLCSIILILRMHVDVESHSLLHSIVEPVPPE